MVEKKLPNEEKVATTYDALNRARVIQARTEPSSGHPTGIQQYRYELGYDVVGNLTRSVETYGSSIPARTLTLEYDKADRLKKEVAQQGGTTAAATTTLYSYDAAHNRTGKSVKAETAAAGASSYTYNACNQLMSAAGGRTPISTIMRTGWCATRA